MLFARLVTLAAAALFTASTVSAALAAPAVAASGPAQGDQAPSLSVSSSVLTQGGSATIRYSNPGMAGQTVVINIDNGSRRYPLATTLEVSLDASGQGSTAWVVPGWDFAKFNAPGVTEVSCVVAK